MACQAVMTKIPRVGRGAGGVKLPPLLGGGAVSQSQLEPVSSTNQEKEYQTYFKSILDLNDYEYLYKVSAQLAESLENVTK